MSLDKKIQKVNLLLDLAHHLSTFYNMAAIFLLGLFLSPLLRHPIVGDLDGSGGVFDYEQQMDNTSNKS